MTLEPRSPASKPSALSSSPRLFWRLRSFWNSKKAKQILNSGWSQLGDVTAFSCLPSARHIVGALGTSTACQVQREGPVACSGLGFRLERQSWDKDLQPLLEEGCPLDLPPSPPVPAVTFRGHPAGHLRALSFQGSKGKDIFGRKVLLLPGNPRWPDGLRDIPEEAKGGAPPLPSAQCRQAFPRCTNWPVRSPEVISSPRPLPPAGASANSNSP